MGYSALKLCVNDQGLQPDPSYHGNTYLNAGRFRLPILLGKVPVWCPMTEEHIEDLPVMPNAYLIVRLFDASTEKPPRHIMPRPNPSLKKINSIAEILYATYDNPLVERAIKRRGLPPLPLWDSVGTDIEQGRQVSGDKWKLLQTMLFQWMSEAFPLSTQMRHTLDVKYALRYAEPDYERGANGCEILAALDMLYNMPIVHPDSVRPNTIIGYKVHFSYLRGQRPSQGVHSSSPDATTTDENPASTTMCDMMDDVSRDWDLVASVPRCPVYVDDFTSIR